ncbi:MAG TPA: hypothetical protein VNI54_04640 [Thermoanaerobaculia bacterium]|nr:hypothetical protein [Thermoanaerobaculia bacterium]
MRSRLTAYRTAIPSPLLPFLPPLDVTTEGRLARGSFDARVPSDFVLGDPSAEPPPAATHPLAAAIRYVIAEITVRRARTMRRVAESDEERQRVTADVRRMREQQERHRDALRRCQAAALQMPTAPPRTWPTWTAVITAALLYVLALGVETAWLTTALADAGGIDLSTPAAISRGAHLLVPTVGAAFFVTVVLVRLLRFVTHVTVRFATARTTQDAAFAPLVAAAGVVVFVLSLLAFIAWLRGTYSVAAGGAPESIITHLGLGGFHAAMLLGGAMAASQLARHRQTLAVLREQRDAFRRDRDTHTQAITFIGITLRDTERRLDDLGDARARLDAEHEQAIAELQSYLQSLLEAGEAIKEQRETWLNVLDAGLTADTQIFGALAHQYGRDDLLAGEPAVATMWRRQ